MNIINFKKWVFILIFSIFTFSCSPVAYTISMEMKKKSEVGIDLNGNRPAIITVADLGNKDSILITNIAIGVAEKMESDLGMNQGDISIFSIHSNQMDFKDPSAVSLLFSEIECDKILVIDSVKVGDFFVKYSDKRIYQDNEFYQQTNTFLPFSLSLSLVGNEMFTDEFHKTMTDSLQWTLISKEYIDEIKAIAKSNSTLLESFKCVGSSIGSMFSTQWEEQERIIIAYDTDVWMKAYYLADNFKWDEAMEIWLKLVKSSDPKKAAFAAFNLSVACEMLEYYELAEKWIDFAKSKYNFKEIELQRGNIKRSSIN